MPLDQPSGVVERLAALLSPEEHARAALFRAGDLQRRFLVSHGALRILVGAQVGREPAALRMRHLQDERAELLDPPPGRAPSFNLSHTGELALVAVTDGAAVGVDVERVRALDDAARLAAKVFTPAEIAALRTLPAERLVEGWFEAWTRKEAVLKALGTGVRGGLQSLELLPPRFAPAATASKLAVELAGPWSVETLRPGPDHVGALAVRATGLRTRLARWPRLTAPG